jgi:hypothetical protein
MMDCFFCLIYSWLSVHVCYCNVLTRISYDYRLFSPVRSVPTIWQLRAGSVYFQSLDDSPLCKKLTHCVLIVKTSTRTPKTAPPEIEARLNWGSVRVQHPCLLGAELVQPARSQRVCLNNHVAFFEDRFYQARDPRCNSLSVRQG